MAITSDWHIHTHCSCDSACIDFETLVEDAKNIGITDFGVSDHYHTRVQEKDIATSRRDYEETIKRHPHLKDHFHFGIEATVISKWEVEQIIKGNYKENEAPRYGIRTGGPKNAPVTFDFDEEFLEKYKIDYVVAGMHWPMYCDTDEQSLIREYHRQYMFAATHPATTILAHYLWWDEGLFKSVWKMPDAVNPFLDFSVISETMRSELKAALKENNVAFELNMCQFLTDELPDTYKDEYLGFVKDLQHSGILISMGSDCHAPHLPRKSYEEAEKIFKHYKINSSEFFCIKK